MIVLDACRDNPFGWSRSGSRGLSVVGRAPAGSIIMYATSANSTAADGTGRNGLFTSQLLNNIKNQSLSIRDVFDKTGEDVLSVSGGKQHPELSLRFFGASSAYLGARPAPAVQPAPVAQQTPAPVLTVQPAPASAVPSGFVRINGGTFTMGDSASGQRRVSVSSFNVSRYEVTQKEYQEIMGVNPSNFKGDNLPVERVSWFDAVEYCNKRSRREGLTPAYTITGRTPTTEYPITFATVTWNRNADGYRLPTEAEWEYSCRAGTTTAYNTGSSISGNTGWYKANSGSSTKPVGQKPANAWGLHDMHGNVWEWCWDWYEAYPNTAQTDPTGAVSGVNRLMRGGSWFHSAENTASAARNSSNPNGRGSDNGFCLVRP
ncbi:MAG: SUMF1/EgtB/PvdO family nonheme iron enzyme [Treponema sp.]|nr:SUMF1/EgtB/PvdO family nonheme iron enzyme [Treponema sp.]